MKKTEFWFLAMLTDRPPQSNISIKKTGIWLSRIPTQTH
jgi:hypothetical protein